MKFGGTSVGSPERMKQVATLMTRSGEPTFVVLSAMSGTTNSLVDISDYLYKKNPDGANDVINALEKKYVGHAEALYSSEEWREKSRLFLREEFDYLRTFTKDLFTSFEEKSIVAQGEVISTNMMVNYLHEQGVDAVLLNALDFMRTDKNGEPDTQYIKEKLQAQMALNAGHQVYVTQGFICRNAYGEVDNLQRGGSDYTASLVGAALECDEIQIWTDIDGMHNNDPRVVDHTEAVHQLNFEEAAELAYFGAKILHPTCIQPAKFAGIPVRLLNTMDPDAEGDFHLHGDRDGLNADAFRTVYRDKHFRFFRKLRKDGGGPRQKTENCGEFFFGTAVKPRVSASGGRKRPSRCRTSRRRRRRRHTERPSPRQGPDISGRPSPRSRS